ncbi:MAG: ATP-binding protein [Pseudomonadota bacterium]
MKKKIFQMTIATKLVLFISCPLFILIAAWAYFNVNYQDEKVMEHIITDADRLTETIRLGTHYAMTLNSRNDINQIIQNIGKQQDIEKIHIFNKNGVINFSNDQSTFYKKADMKDETCHICHQSDPPLIHLSLEQRTRIWHSSKGYRMLGILTPIYNDTGCSGRDCHFHPKKEKILGVLDVVISLESQDKEIKNAKKAIVGLAIFGFFIIFAVIFIFVNRVINTPIQQLIKATISIAGGDYKTKVNIGHSDEMGQLSEAINRMGDQIHVQQTELNEQRNEYRTLFNDTPCMISVQDKEYRLLRYNRKFQENFDPKPGSFCFSAYKGKDGKCGNCPVEKTFKDGLSHYGETSGIGRDGTKHYWIFITSPIKNAKGEVIAAIEMSLDITENKQLEKQLETSKQKYQSIFNNIPNPVFVVDEKTLQLIDCNQSVESVYGFNKHSIIGTSFLDFFIDGEKHKIKQQIQTSSILNQIKQKNKDNKTLYVDIWISPSEYEDKKVFLVTTSDITQRLKTEKELMQAGKMATLGEMSTGIAHELNQPLSVIKTASDFILKKANQNIKIEDSVYNKLLIKINSNVDRASKIIEHMRHFARKSDINFEDIHINTILKRAHDIFSQQLKVRGINVVWHLTDDLPMIIADPGRIEQVFINLLMNARDAIEEKSEKTGSKIENETIIIKTFTKEEHVVVTVSDTGIGIDDQIREKIFEPFFTTKEVGKGTGIGLSISYGIIKECKGHIEVAPGLKTGGTTFIIQFPFAKKPTGMIL